jgi:alpha-1,2-mannosyltransferase
VNLLLVALVTGDFLYGVRRRRWWGGIGIGLASAIKLTPAVFILYLLLTRRWRAAIVSTVTAGAATLFAAVVAPDATRVFFTEALLDTNRVGNLASVANQSLRGTVGRLNPYFFHSRLWLLAVLVTLGFWAWRVWRAGRVGDDILGFALTAVVGCLVSPVTWVHHLVWLMPALLLLTDRGFAARGLRRWALIGLAGGLYVLLCSRTVWHFVPGQNLKNVVGGNAYVFASLALLALVPTAPRGSAANPQPASAGSAEPDESDLGEVGDPVVAPADLLEPGRPVRGEAGPLVEAQRPVVVAEHP